MVGAFVDLGGLSVMDLGMYLSCNFFPAIPADIQEDIQAAFDVIIGEGQPYAVELDGCGNFETGFSNSEVLDRVFTLRNGAEMPGFELLDKLRLWDAVEEVALENVV